MKLLLGASGIYLMGMMWPVMILLLVGSITYIVGKKIDLVIKESQYDSISYKTFVARKQERNNGKL